MKYIKFFKDIDISDISLVGGKNTSLGEMYQSLKKSRVKVPNGFAVTSKAYHLLLSENDLQKKIKAVLKDLNTNDVENLKAKGKKIRELILGVSIPKPVESEIASAYEKLSKFYKKDEIDVAVRSSGTAEDLPEASFAGQQETYLNVAGKEYLIDSVKKCFASLFTDRAISYRQSRGFDHFKVAISVGVQKMVRSDCASSGIMFTIDTESGSENIIMINSTWGLGENIVGGKVNPDEFYIFKPTLKKGFPPIIKRSLGDKKIKMIYSEGKNKTKNINTPKAQRGSFSLIDDEAVELAGFGLAIEKRYSKIAGEYRPMDIEWAKDANTGELFIVQARPETVQSKKIKERGRFLKKYSLKKSVADKTMVLASGRAVGEKVGKGKIKKITKPSQFSLFEEGEVLVAEITDPDWEPIMKKASAVVTDKGGRTCHAAIVARGDRRSRRSRMQKSHFRFKGRA